MTATTIPVMPDMKRLALTISMLLVVAFSATTVAAQTYTDAVTAFNEGDELARGGKHKEAIAAFERVITISNTLGTEGAEIKKKAEDYIPQLHFALAVGLAREGKLLDAATAFEATITVSRRYNNANLTQRAQQGLLQAYYSAGNQALQARNFERAIELYDKTIGVQNTFAQAYYNKGLALRNLGRGDEALEQFDRAIQLAQVSRNNQIQEAATGAARNYLLLKAAESKSAKKYPETVAFLKQAIEYKEADAELHYRLAEVYNVMALFDAAIESANKALEFETGGPVDRARIWFELGYAYKFKANVSAACEAYKNASFGDFRAGAEHAMQHELKCPKN
jgi:tetratricopeptide (TPR) repeat protein